MVLLHRGEELADPGERNDLRIRGIVSLLSRIRLVEYDEFGASIISDTYGLLVSGASALFSLWTTNC